MIYLILYNKAIRYYPQYILAKNNIFRYQIYSLVVKNYILLPTFGSTKYDFLTKINLVGKTIPGKYFKFPPTFSLPK